MKRRQQKSPQKLVRVPPSWSVWTSSAQEGGLVYQLLRQEKEFSGETQPNNRKSSSCRRRQTDQNQNQNQSLTLLQSVNTVSQSVIM